MQGIVAVIVLNKKIRIKFMSWYQLCCESLSFFRLSLFR